MGSTLYELCATQTSAITYVLADNQIPGADGFSARGIMKTCGDVRELGTLGLAQKLIEAAIKLCGNYNERCRISKKMSTVVDGRGTERIVRAILSTANKTS